MEKKKSVLVEVQIGKILASVFLIGIGLPLVLGTLLAIPLTSVLSFIGSIALLQALAAPVGVLLGFEPWVVLAIMTSFAVGICLAIWELLQTFALTSDRVNRWIGRVEQKMQDHRVPSSLWPDILHIDRMDSGNRPLWHPGYRLDPPVGPDIVRGLHGNRFFPRLAPDADYCRRGLDNHRIK